MPCKFVAHIPSCTERMSIPPYHISCGPTDMSLDATILAPRQVWSRPRVPCLPLNLKQALRRVDVDATVQTRVPSPNLPLEYIMIDVMIVHGCVRPPDGDHWRCFEDFVSFVDMQMCKSVYIKWCNALFRLLPSLLRVSIWFLYFSLVCFIVPSAIFLA